MRGWLRKISGFIFLFAGLIISIPVIVPGWGLPVILIGLGILAPEYEWAGRLNRKALDLYHRILAKMKLKGKKGESP